MGATAIIAGIGGAMGAAGALYEGQAAAKAGQLNAAALRLKASQIRAQAIQDEHQTIVTARKIVGGMQSGYAASGVTMEGSPMDIMEESVTNASRDALNIKYSGEMNARSAEFEAKMQVFKGESAKTASYYSAASSLAAGGTKAYEYSKLS